ncbi:MAG: hypothetical protein ABSB41_01115 [Anaerolineales bacterium]
MARELDQADAYLKIADPGLLFAETFIKLLAGKGMVGMVVQE